MIHCLYNIFCLEWFLKYAEEVDRFIARSLYIVCLFCNSHYAFSIGNQ